MTSDELTGDNQTTRPVSRPEIAPNAAKFVVRHSPFVIGLDAGGTKTACVLARADDGAVLGHGVGGPGNIHAAGAARVAASLADAVGAAFQDVGLAPESVAAVALGAAGAARPDDRAVVERLLRAAVPAARYMVTNDGAIALRAAIPAGPGVLIVAGTGSIGYGRTVSGDEVRTGGWGYLLGDEGSAFAVGLAGLAAVLRAHDGRAAPTTLGAALLDAWALATPEGLIARVYRQPPPREEIAALAPLIAVAARAGDVAAAGIMDNAGGALGDLAATTARKLGVPPATPAPVVTAGGFWHAAADLLLPPFLARVQAAGIAIAHRETTVEPVYGALALARALLNREL
ncbi:MAG TPA: BadF/BadG/BcrA/BcrD ATPase family protein [Thermomicrobiales bacterium]|nr:BadF/BadG/BcrA/BcrD ATPase family protein [Thermomicrobiales bacterium]